MQNIETIVNMEEILKNSDISVRFRTMGAPFTL